VLIDNDQVQRVSARPMSSSAIYQTCVFLSAGFAIRTQIVLMSRTNKTAVCRLSLPHCVTESIEIIQHFNVLLLLVRQCQVYVCTGWAKLSDTTLHFCL